MLWRIERLSQCSQCELHVFSRRTASGAGSRRQIGVASHLPTLLGRFCSRHFHWRLGPRRRSQAGSGGGHAGCRRLLHRRLSALPQRRTDVEGGPGEGGLYCGREVRSEGRPELEVSDEGIKA